MVELKENTFQTGCAQLHLTVSGDSLTSVQAKLEWSQEKEAATYRHKHTDSRFKETCKLITIQLLLRMSHGYSTTGHFQLHLQLHTPNIPTREGGEGSDLSAPRYKFDCVLHADIHVPTSLLH